MPRLSSADLARVRELAAPLGTLAQGGRPGLEALVDALASLLDAEKSCAYGLSAPDGRLAADFVHAGGSWSVDLPREMSAYLRGAPVRFGMYDSLRPEPRQRNVALRYRELAPRYVRARTPIYSELYRRVGVENLEQMRVLVCDGPAFLAWVGVYRPEPFTLRERRMLQALVPAMQWRLRTERLLGDEPLLVSALDAVLEAVPAPALVVKPNGEVAYANSAGRAFLEADRRGMLEALQADLKGRPAPVFALTRLSAPGLGEHYLAVQRAPPADPAPRAAAAAARWGLTPRQAQVLSLLARGDANKTISAALGCSLRTVELHVAALLAKSGAESRAQLVARFWTL